MENNSLKNLSEQLKGLNLSMPKFHLPLHESYSPSENVLDLLEVTNYGEILEGMDKRLQSLEKAIEKGPNRTWWEHPLLLLMFGGICGAVFAKLIM